MKKTLILVVCMVMALAACNKGNAPVTAASSNSGKPALAKINDVTVTEDDLKREVGYLQPEVREMFAEEGGLKAIMDEVVKKEVLYQEAKKNGFQDSPEFKTRVEEYKKRVSIEMLLEKQVIGGAKVEDKDVRDFYDKNIEKFAMRGPDGKKGKTIEFEKVKSLIHERLLAEKQKETFDKYMEDLKKAYKVEINKEAIDKIAGNIGLGNAAGASPAMKVPAAAPAAPEATAPAAKPAAVPEHKK